jgi:hypothetical protein
VQKSPSLAIRAGTGGHRFIRIWAVVVQGRLFVRSWSLKPGGWYRTFLDEPRGAVRVGTRAIPVRAVKARAARLNAAIDKAYLEKYGTGGLRKYALDMVAAKSRATTLELVPEP